MPLTPHPHPTRSFISLAALFSEWSSQTVPNPELPLADLSTRTNYLFSSKVCTVDLGNSIKVGDVTAFNPPLECTTFASWDAYYNTISVIPEFNYKCVDGVSRGC